MAKNYKLTEEIKKFIVEQKKADPHLSCRAIIPLIKAHFGKTLSKSLINKVIKENKLSNPPGRRNIGQKPSVFRFPVVTKIVRKEVDFMENGGCFFLKAAEIKLNLNTHLTQNLTVHFPQFSLQEQEALNEEMIYYPLFKNKKSLWTLTGKEITFDNLERYWQQLSQLPLSELNDRFLNKIFNHNINKVNELYRDCLQKLNAYVQLNFFPPIYKIMDFSAMQEQFYGLPAKIEKKPSLLRVQLLYPENFIWAKDLVWEDDFSYAAQKVNKAGIFTAEGEQIWFNSTPIPR